jgi:hypothetical protein
MKLVKEILYEKFTSDSDPIKDLGIGIKHKIEEWIKYIRQHHGTYTITDYVINDDMSIDASKVDISFNEIDHLPNYIKFNNIERSFSCCFNDIETIRKHGPKNVGENYKIYHTKPISFTEKDIKKICNVNGFIRINAV